MSDQELKQSAVYDVVIVGGGTGGYVSAIRAAQLGLRALIVEEDKAGGTCLHRGCIPSKAYLKTAEVLRQTLHAQEYGVVTATPALNWTQVVERKNQIVQTLYAGVQSLLQRSQVEVVHGRGSIVRNNGQLAVRVQDRIISARHVLMATGSRPMSMGLSVNQHIMTSDQALTRAALPESVVIVGGGAIGMEWASLYQDCGVQVTVVEAASRIVPSEDEEVSKELQRWFERRGVRFLTAAKVDFSAVSYSGNAVRVPVTDAGGQSAILRAEALLLAVGRRPNVENLGLEALGVARKGHYVQTNEYQQTSCPGLYAAGDMCGGGLAHVAAWQGIIAVEHIAGLQPRAYNPRIVPKCTYTNPEVASVGLTEAAAIAQGANVRVGKFPFRAIGKSLIAGEFDGFAKIVTDADSGLVLGVHLIGPHATELIAEGNVLLANELDIQQWQQTIHPHPSLSEVLHEAALAVTGQALHM